MEQFPSSDKVKKRKRISEWAKLIAITGSAQIIVQAIGFISGILVIRLLPTHEYALYTLANTMLGTMTLLADGGIANGVMSQGGKVWQDKQKLGAVLVTGMHLRKKFAVFSLLVAVPILFYLLRKHDASWLMSSLIMLSLVPAFFTSLSGTLLEIPIKLHQDIRPLQKITVSSNLIRLVTLGLTLFIYPFAAVAIAGAGLGQIWSNWRLRIITRKKADYGQGVNNEVKDEIVKNVRRILPTTIYYCVSGQLSIWIISFFGATDVIAQFGALSRLGVFFGLVSTLISMLFIPRFVRMPNNAWPLMRRFIQLQLFLFSISLIILVLVWNYQDKLLWIIGSNYSDLTFEVVLMAVGACMQLISGNTNQLLSGRGIIVPPLVFIPTVIVCQVGVAFLIHPVTLYGVLLFNIYSSLVIYATRLMYFILIFYYDNFSES